MFIHIFWNFPNRKGIQKLKNNATQYSAGFWPKAMAHWLGPGANAA
jgi:hypothetical protein